MKNINTIHFKGTFDGSQILSSLKQVRNEMNKSGVDNNLFKNVDKDLALAEKLVQNLTAQIQKGFSPNEISGFEKELNKLNLIFNKITVGFQDINKISNFSVNSSALLEAQKTLQNLIDKQQLLDNAAKDSVTTQLESIKLRKSEREQILNEVKAQGELEEAVKRVAREKERAAKLKIGKEVLDTNEGQNLINKLGNAVTLTADDLGLKATNKAKKRGHEDIRQRNGNKIIRDADGNQILDEDKGTLAILEEYPKVFKKIVESGGNATDAVELMKKAIDDYGAEITETNKLQESFAKDLDNFYNNGLNASQQKRLNNARVLGSTDGQGNVSLSDVGRDIVNNYDVANMNQNTVAIEQQRAIVEERKAAAVDEAVQKNKILESTIEELNKEIAKSNSENNKNTQEMKKSAQASKELFAGFDRLKDVIKEFISLRSAVRAVKQAISQTITDIKELDKSFASIAMVTNYSVAEMWASYDDYAEMANRLGQSTKDVIASSALFYQQGLDTAEALKLTESTMKLATLAGSDFETATSQMTAALRGFHMEMSEGERITDVYSELAAKAAADVNDIAYAMSKTASIASSAGMEFETTSAFLTQMIETTQEAPENIGTAMKTIIARFTELKENVAGTDKSQFDDLDYNKVDKALKSVGVSLKDTNGQFRDIDDVFLDLSERWDTLDRNTQRYIATTAAGSRQQSRFLALMENYDRTIELVDTAYNSAGRSSEQFGKYSDTLEYKMNQLKNTWEQVRLSFMDSTFLKDIVDSLSELLTRVQDFDMIDIGALAATWLTFGRHAITSFIEGVQEGTVELSKTIGDKIAELPEQAINKLSNKLAQAGKHLPEKLSKLSASLSVDTLKSEVFQKKEDMRKFEDYTSDSVKNSDSETLKALLAKHEDENDDFTLDEFDEGYIRSRLEIEDDEDKISKLKERQAQMGEAAGEAFSTAFSTAVTSFQTTDNPGEVFTSTIIASVVSALPAMATAGSLAGIALTGGISLAIGAVVGVIGFVWKLIDNYIESLKKAKFEYRFEEAKKEAEEAKKAADEAAAAARETKEEYQNIKDIKERFEELNSKTALTVEEQSEYNDLVAEIRETMPEIVTYYNDVTGELQVQNDLWEQILEKEKQVLQTDAKKSFDTQVNSAEKNAISERMTLINNAAQKYGLTGDVFENQEGFENFKEQILGVLNGITYNIAQNPSLEKNLNLDQTFEYANVDLNTFLEAFHYSRQYFDDLGSSQEKVDFIINLLTESGGELEKAFNSLQNSIDDVDKAYKDQVENLYGEYLTNLNPDIGNFEKEYRISANSDIIVNAQDLVDQNWYTVEGDGDRQLESVASSYVDGDAHDTASDNRQISSRILADYGMTTPAMVYKAFSESYDSAEAAEKAWDEMDGKKRIVTAIQNSIVTMLNNASTDFDTLSDDKKTEVEASYAELIEGGYNQQDINDFDIYTQGIGLKNNDQIIQELNDNLATATENAISWGMNSGLAQGLTTDTLNQFSNVIGSISEQIGEEEAKNYGQTLSNIFTNAGLTSEQISMALGSVDWSTVDYLNLEDTKQKFIDTMKESMGASFDETKVNALWEHFFATAKNYNVVDFTLNPIGVESIADQLNEEMLSVVDSYDKVTGQIETSISQGGIDFSGYMELSSVLDEVGLKVEDYTSLMNNGLYSLDHQALTAAYQQQIEDTDTIIQNIKEQLKTQRAQLQAKLVALEATAQEKGASAALLPIENALTDAAIEQAKAKAAIAGTTYETDWIAQDQIDTTLTYGEVIEDLKAQIANIDATLEDDAALQQMADAQKAASTQIINNYNKALQNGTEAKNEDAGASEDVAKADKELAEAQKKLNEALYGTELYKGASDALSNYTTRLEELGEAADEAREKLEALTSEDSPSQLMDDYIRNVKQEAVTLEAENRVIEQSMTNMRKVLDENYSQYFKENNGKLYWNASLNDAQMNDQFKDYVYQQIEEYNKLSDNIKENNKKIEAREKEYQEMRKAGIDARVALEDKVVQVLEEKYQAEIDATQKKYEALKEADDDYLSALEEAIQKQRDLREREDKYQDLATQEKRLALLRRDTSGANRKIIASEEEKLEESRQEMMDNEVDRIIDEMKKLYETQQESRDAEIEYMEAMKENAVLVQEANEILANHQTYDELLQWFYENNSALTEKSVAQLEQFNMELEDEFNKAQLYFETSAEDIKDLTAVTEEEVLMTMEEIGETLTTEADRSFQEVTEKVKEEIEAAQEGLQSALEAATSASNAVAGAAGALVNAANNFGSGNDNNSISESQSLSPMQQLVKNNKKRIKNDIVGPLTPEQQKLKKIGVLNNSQAQTAYYSSPVYKATESLKKLKQRAIAYKTFESNRDRISISSGTVIKSNSQETPNFNAKYRIKDGNFYYYFNDDTFIKKYGDYLGASLEHRKNNYWTKYATGGLVDYTGPAWVDGTPNKPEAFLNSEDTKRIGEAAKLLSNLPILNSTSSSQNAVSANVGDTSIEIHINVENLASDYDVDQMIERVKQDIVDISKPIGTPVILRR